MIFISGPMTGYPEYNYPAFNAAALALRSAGHKVFNPAENPIIRGAPRRSHMLYDLRFLVLCDEILMLPGWERSIGARAEHAVAVSLGMFMHYDMSSIEEKLDTNVK